MDDLDKLAKGLKPWCRDALLAFPTDNPWLDEYSTPPWPNLHVRADLGALGMMRPGAVFNHAYRLTPLGLALKAHIERNERDPAA